MNSVVTMLLLLVVVAVAVVGVSAIPGGGGGVNYPVTVVSGYWIVSSKHTVASYREWFRNTLKVQCPYVFYHDSNDVVNVVGDIRKPNNKLPTLFVRRNLTSTAEKFNYGKKWTHKKHVKSPELAVVWLDKVHMMAEVAAANPFHSEWFAWIGELTCL